MRRFERYRENLSIVRDVDGDWIQSYETKVAKIDYAKGIAEVLGWWSVTTSKHINYACKELGLKQTKGEKS